MVWEKGDLLKLMVVDDEPDNLDLLYRTFRKEFRVFKASNGSEALAMLAKEGEMSVIISDQRMPRMNGTEFLSRTVDDYPDTIRIVLTGYTDVEDLVEAINSGKVFKYITKPWNPDHLRAVVMQAADIYRVVKKRTFELTRALERESFFHRVMSAIRESLDYTHILQSIVTTLGDAFEAHYAALHAIDEAEPAGASSFEKETGFSHIGSPPPGELALLEEHACAANHEALETGECCLETLSDFSAPVRALSVPLIYQQRKLAAITLYQVDSSEHWMENARQLIGGVAEQIALAISQAKLYQRTQEQTRQMQAELEVARQIQTNLLRQSFPDPDGIRIQARCLPARQVGGDFFEVFAHPQGDFWLAVGDVSGKGVPAALFMASAISVLRRELSQENPPTPERVMQNLNSSLFPDLAGTNCFITMVLVRYTPGSHQLLYANAGHIYPLTWSMQTLQSAVSEPKYLTTRGIPLGILPQWNAELGKLLLTPGETLLLVSDGLTEATVPSDAQIGKRAMLKQSGLWQLLQQQPAPLDLDKLLQAIQGDNAERDDDQTVLLLEVG